LLDAPRLKEQKLTKEAVENDPLYRWSKLRSEYASESNVNVGNALVAEGGWFGPGWYWDPFLMDFAFMPGYVLGSVRMAVLLAGLGGTTKFNFQLLATTRAARRPGLVPA
jgi:hypothetical protein